MSNLQFRFSGYLHGYRFRPSWLGTLVTICCIPLFIKLGFWQYNKAEQKKALQATYEKYGQSPPLKLPAVIDKPEEWRYRPVAVSGVYLPQYQFFLDNQVEGEAVGYHVITPLQMEGTETVVLIDRGWITARDDHSEVPHVETPSGKQDVIGKVWLPSARFYTLAKADALADPKLAQEWQAVWQNMDMSRYAKLVPFKTLPVAIRLDAASKAGGFVRNWVLPDDRVATNVSYAYQWFGFAVAAVIIYIVVSFKKAVPNAA